MKWRYRVLVSLCFVTALGVTACGKEDVSLEETIEVVETPVEEPFVIEETTVFYSGAIDEYPINLTITYDSGGILGYYYYKNQETPTPINLYGNYLNTNEITLNTDDGEVFEGVISNEGITGQWTKGDKNFEFNVDYVTDLITYDEQNVGFKNNSRYQRVVSDGEYHYIGWFDEILKADIDGNSVETFYEFVPTGNYDNDYYTYPYIPNDYTNLRINDGKLYAGDEYALTHVFDLANGESLLNTEDIKAYYEELENIDVYNDIIYENASVIGGEYPYVMDGYVYNRGFDEDQYYRISLDGTERELLELNDVLNIEGIIGEWVIYKKEFSQIWKQKLDGTEAQMIYESPIGENGERNYVDGINNTKDYIVFSHSDNSNNISNLVVMDINGDIINEVEVETDYNGRNIYPEVLGDYIYFTMDYESINRVKYNEDEIFVLDEAEDTKPKPNGERTYTFVDKIVFGGYVDNSLKDYEEYIVMRLVFDGENVQGYWAVEYGIGGYSVAGTYDGSNIELTEYETGNKLTGTIDGHTLNITRISDEGEKEVVLTSTLAPSETADFEQVLKIFDNYEIVDFKDDVHTADVVLKDSTGEKIDARIVDVSRLEYNHPDSMFGYVMFMYQDDKEIESYHDDVYGEVHVAESDEGCGYLVLLGDYKYLIETDEPLDISFTDEGYTHENGYYRD